jgi:hypothetical protein
MIFAVGRSSGEEGRVKGQRSLRTELTWASPSSIVVTVKQTSSFPLLPEQIDMASRVPSIAQGRVQEKKMTEKEEREKGRQASHEHYRSTSPRLVALLTSNEGFYYYYYEISHYRTHNLFH